MNKAEEIKKLIDEGERLFAEGKHEAAAVVTNQVRRGMCDLLIDVKEKVNGSLDARLDRLEARINEIGSPEHLQKNLNSIAKNMLWQHKGKLILFGFVPFTGVIHVDHLIKFILMLLGG